MSSRRGKMRTVNKSISQEYIHSSLRILTSQYDRFNHGFAKTINESIKSVSGKVVNRRYISKYFAGKLSFIIVIAIFACRIYIWINGQLRNPFIRMEGYEMNNLFHQFFLVNTKILDKKVPSQLSSARSLKKIHYFSALSHLLSSSTYTVLRFHFGFYDQC